MDEVIHGTYSWKSMYEFLLSAIHARRSNGYHEFLVRNKIKFE